MLYIRMLFIMGVTLYASRVVLTTLGEVDFGIYNLVGGVVMMFTFLNASLSGATARFITYELGRGKEANLQKVFNACLIVHIIVALIVLVLAETVGVWLLRNKLVIPPDREWAAYIVYQLSILTTLVSIVQIPYNALIIAYERMNVFAYLGIADALLRLLSIYLLLVGGMDKLILYGILTFLVGMVIAFLYRFYCIRHFPQTRFRFRWDKKILWPIFTFSGWDLYANMSGMARGQGVNILQNMFFGPVINSATGIANQVQGAVNAFADNFLTSVRPQIVKEYATGNYLRMLNLVENAAKYSFILLLFVSLPLLIENRFILQVWLKDVPDYTVAFCRLSLIGSLMLVIFRPIMFSIHATGRVKWMSLINGTIYLLVLPITYGLFKRNYSPVSPFVVLNIFLFFICGLFNLKILKSMLSLFSIKTYLHKVIARCFGIALFSTPFPVGIAFFMEKGWVRFICVGLTAASMVALASYLIGLGRGTRKKVNQRMRNKVKEIYAKIS